MAITYLSQFAVQQDQTTSYNALEHYVRGDKYTYRRGILAHIGYALLCAVM
jgi:hypothetical protein